MFANRVFQITLLISAITHGVILLQNSHLSLFSTDKKEPNLKVSYVKAPKETETILKTQRPRNIEPFLKLPPKINLDKKIPPPFIDKENGFIAKPAFIKPDIIAIKKKITLPPIDTTKINNPSYISYCQVLREKIKRAAYQNYTGRQIGEVTVSFTISNNGYLRDLRLIEDKSSDSIYLREVALRSINDASAFPNFPKELDYPQLPFSLTITFEVE